MKRILITALTACVVCLFNIHAVAESTSSSVKGVQLYGGGIFKTELETIAFIDKCKRHGVTVILPGLSAGPDALWKTDSQAYADDQKAVLDSGYDALEGLVRHAHAADIKVYPSIAVYFAGDLLNDHPEWETLDREGRPSRETYGSAALAFSFPEARRAKIEMLMDLVTGYDIDGVLLDRLRYPENTKKPEWNHGYYGYDPLVIEACMKTYDFDPTKVPVGSEKWEIFAQLKAETIACFLVEFRDSVESSGRDIRIGVFAAPDPARRRAQSGRDYGAWGKRGLIDDLYLGMYTQSHAEITAAIPGVRSAIGERVMLYTSLSPYNNQIKNEDEMVAMAKTHLACDIDGLWVYRTDFVDSLDLWQGVSTVSAMTK